MSSTSSFSAINDNESVFDGSFIDRSVSRTSTIGGAEIDEIEKLKMRIALLELENMDKSNQKVLTELESFKTQLSGDWKLVSSTNVKEYLEKRKGNILDDVVFQLASKHFNFDRNSLTTYETAGINIFNKKTNELSKCEFSGDMAHVTFISDNRLKTIQLGRNENESSREEVFVSVGGQLHVILKAFGVECTRIYQKMGDKTTTENRENLRELQQEHDELKDKYVTDIARLEKALEMEQQRSQQRELELKKKNDEFMTKVAKLNAIIQEKEQKEQQPYGHLAELFNGYWAHPDGYRNRMIRIEGDQFILHFEDEIEPRFYTFEVEKLVRERHQIVKVDGSKIRHQYLESSGGSATFQHVYRVENGTLKATYVRKGKKQREDTYDKCHEPFLFPI